MSLEANLSPEHAQRIIYRGLSRAVKDFSQLQTAYNYWQTNYAEKPWDVIEFSSGLQSYLGLNSDQKRTLLITLHASMQHHVDDLEPVPEAISAFTSGNSPPVLGGGSTSQVDKKESEGFKPSMSAHWVITEGFMRSLANAIRKLSPEAIIELQEVILEEPISLDDKALSNMLVQWAKSGFSSLALDKNIEPKQCRDCVHALYLATCDAVGPFDTDLLVTKAKAAVIDLPEASTFHPDKLF